MSETLSREELFHLIDRVFRPRPDDRALAVLVDLPDARVPEQPGWEVRRAMAADWWRQLRDGRDRWGFEVVDLVCYRNVHSNNADFPARGSIRPEGDCPARAEDLDGPGESFDRIFSEHRILIAATEFSATAPLKLNARKYGFRAATMPGFTAAMIPALRLDYVEVQRRCDQLKQLLDQAVMAHLRFEVAGDEHRLDLDLRHRTAIASGGLITEPGTAGNLPSGETYIVPYEGEREGDPSRTRGMLPIELEGELLTYRIENNRVVEVLGGGPRAESERRAVADEPAYANIAELGLGLLSDYGVQPVGELLLDEKLGLHIAFGRSDHFGGTVGAKDFSSPDRVVHIDRVYIPQVQPSIRVAVVELELPDRRLELIRDDRYVVGVG